MEKKAVSSYRWIVLLLYMYITALTQLFWLNFAAIDTYIEKHLNVSAMSVGLLAMIFPLTYLIISIPTGILIDKKGFKFSVGTGALLTAFFSLVRLVSPTSYTILFISQFGISLGQPFVLNGMTKLAALWFPKDEEATAVGLGSLALFIGMLIGLGATPAIVQFAGYKTMLISYAIFALLGLFLFVVFAKEKPDTPPEEISGEEAQNKEETSYIKGIKELFRMKDFILLGFLALIGIGGFNGLATWLEKMLTEMHGITMVQAGNVSSALIFSGMLGCIVIPLLSDKAGKRKPFIIIASAMAILTLSILIFAKGYLANVLNSIFLGFFLISALPIMLTMSAELAGPKLAGISVSYLQLLGNGAAVLIVPLMEFLHKSSNRYILPIVFLIALFVISLILGIIIKETGNNA